jgi:hypothetical protein
VSEWTIARPPRLTQENYLTYRSREGAAPRRFFFLFVFQYYDEPTHCFRTSVAEECAPPIASRAGNPSQNYRGKNHRKKNLRQSASRAHGSQQLRRDSPSVESRQERRCAESARESCTPVERCRAENDAFGVAEFNRRLHDERRFVEFHHPVKDKEQRGQRGHGATGQKTRFRNAGNLALPIRRIELLRCHP